MCNKKNVLSLFTGCGGMDLGFEGDFNVLIKSINPFMYPEWNNETESDNWIHLPKTIFKTVFANDILRAAKASWVPYFKKRGNSEKDFYLESIVELVKKYKKSDFVFPDVDIVTGGFPCQDFSLAGKRNGFNSHKAHNGDSVTSIDLPSEENRGQLYLWMRNVVEITKPKVFIAENVKGLISLENAKKIIENDFRKIGGDGYLVVNARVLKAPNYGIPQTRERVIFIGFRKESLKDEALINLSKSVIPEDFDPYPPITHINKEQCANGPNVVLSEYVKVSDAFIDLDEPEISNDISQQSYSKAKWYGDHCQGQSEINIDGLGPTIRAEHHGNIEFRRLSLEHCGKYTQELSDGMKERRLTVRECARIQTFPDDYDFVRKPTALGKENKLSVSEGYKVIGNAVPPLLAFHIAWRLQELWSTLFKEE